jgi:hypothetical protein
MPYNEWGTDALARFDGMFALGYYDLDRETLLLARDPVGIKPLYVLEHRLGVVFGSQYDQVVRHPWCERQRIDIQALGSFLRLGWVPPPEGLIEGTRMIEPGTALIVDVGVPPRDHFTFRTFFSDSPTIDDPNRVNALVDEAVRSSVEAQLVSDVPVGVFLSGGIDSPLVAAEAARSAPEVPSFTIGSDDPLHDESSDARRYAHAIGTHHVERTLSAAEARSPRSTNSCLPTASRSATSPPSPPCWSPSSPGSRSPSRCRATAATSSSGATHGSRRLPTPRRGSGGRARCAWRRARPSGSLPPTGRPRGSTSPPSATGTSTPTRTSARPSLAKVAPQVAPVWSHPPRSATTDHPRLDPMLLWMRRNEWRYHLPNDPAEGRPGEHAPQPRGPGPPARQPGQRGCRTDVEPSVCIGQRTDGKLPLRTALSPPGSAATSSPPANGDSPRPSESGSSTTFGP